MKIFINEEKKHLVYKSEYIKDPYMKFIKANIIFLQEKKFAILF